MLCDKLKVGLARCLDILFGELAQLLRNVKGLILLKNLLINAGDFETTSAQLGVR
jgi:hypothetical protein